MHGRLRLLGVALGFFTVMGTAQAHVPDAETHDALTIAAHRWGSAHPPDKASIRPCWHASVAMPG